MFYFAAYHTKSVPSIVGCESTGCGSHESRTYQPAGLPQQFFEAGVYENDYVREAGIWKIKRLDYMMQWQADYDKGWSKTVAHLQPATETYPANPLGPDVLLPPAQVRKTWPHRQDVPMHFAHPRFGAILAAQASAGVRA